MRRILFWIHLAAGVLISLLVIFFSVTGALLAYQREILRAADQHFYTPERHTGDTRIPLPSLLAAIPGTAETVTVYSEPEHPIEVLTKSRDLYLLDPYSGRVQGPASPKFRAFFAEVTALHRWFGLSNANHATATAIKGASVLLFLVVLTTGPILWMPKSWTRAAVVGGIAPRFNTRGRARNHNWHKVAGFWVGLPLTIIVITGIIMAYPWANTLLFRLAGSPVPQRPSSGASRARESATAVVPARLDEAFSRATGAVEGWQSASLRLPSGQSMLSFGVDRSEGGHPEKREQVTLDSVSLRIVRRGPFAALNRGQRWRAWVRFTHTGEAGGWWGESLALISASGAVVLAITSLALSYYRLQRWRSQG